MTAETAGEPAPPSAPAADAGWRLRHLPPLLTASAGTVVAAAIIGWLAAGGTAALGAAVGVILVAAGHLLSTVVMARADEVDPALVKPFGLMAYVVKITVIGGAMTMAALAGWAGMVPMAWGIAAGVLAWTGTHLLWLARHRSH